MGDCLDRCEKNEDGVFLIEKLPLGAINWMCEKNIRKWQKTAVFSDVNERAHLLIAGKSLLYSTLKV